MRRVARWSRVFTTLRDVETERRGVYGDIEIKQAIEDGNDVAGREFSECHPGDIEYGRIQSGRVCAGTGNAPRARSLWMGRVEARKAGAWQLTGAWTRDCIKVYMTHRYVVWTSKGNLVSQPTLTVEELKAIVDETHGWQKKVACHAYNGVSDLAAGLGMAEDATRSSTDWKITDAHSIAPDCSGQGMRGYCATLSP